MITLATEQEFPYWLAVGTMVRGWAQVEQEQEEEGIAQIRQGLAGYSRTGAEGYRTWYLGLLVEAYEKVGCVDEGLSVVAEALAKVRDLSMPGHGGSMVCRWIFPNRMLPAFAHEPATILTQMS